MFAGRCSLFDDGALLSRIDGDVDDLYLRLTQQLIDAGIEFYDSVFFSCTLACSRFLSVTPTTLNPAFLYAGRCA